MYSKIFFASYIELWLDLKDSTLQYFPSSSQLCKLSLGRQGSRQDIKLGKCLRIMEQFHASIILSLWINLECS